MKYAVFHKLIEGCLQADPIAWHELAQKYAPFLRQRFVQYFQEDKKKKGEVAEAYFEDCRSRQQLTKCSNLTEREFLLFLVFDFLQYGRHRYRSDDSQSTDLRDLHDLFDGMSLAHQKCVFLLLEKYPKDLIQGIFRIGSVLTYNANDELQKRLAEKGRSEVRIHLSEKEQIRQARTERCETERVVGNLIDGNLPWADRERVQGHLQECLHCLQNLVMSEEIEYFLRMSKY